MIGDSFDIYIDTAFADSAFLAYFFWRNSFQVQEEYLLHIVPEAILDRLPSDVCQMIIPLVLDKLVNFIATLLIGYL